MSKKKKPTRAELQADMQKLQDKMDRLAEESISIFDKAVFTKEVKDIVMDLTSDEIRKIGQAVRSMIIKNFGNRRSAGFRSSEAKLIASNIQVNSNSDSTNSAVPVEQATPIPTDNDKTDQSEIRAY